MKNKHILLAIRKRSKLMAIFFVIIISNLTFSGCYSTQSVNEYPLALIPGTTTFISFSHYDYEVLNKGNNVYGIYFYKVNNCQGKKNVSVIKNKEKKAGRAFLFNLPHSIAICYTQVLDKGGTDELTMGIIAGVFVGLIPYFIWGFKAPRNKTVNREKQKTYIFQEKQLLPNATVKIECNNQFFTKKTDSFGLLYIKDILIEDLNINYSEKDNPFYLSFYVNEKMVGNALTVRPSEFLNRYVKVNKKSTKIWTNIFKSNIKSIANTGSEYKTDIYFESRDLYRIELVGSKQGYISKKDVDTYYSTEKKSDVKQTIQGYIQEKIVRWEKQGEFEPPVDYKLRMSDYECKVKEWYDEAIKLYQKEYIDLINWEQAKISRYDPNNQTFKINIPGLDTLIVHVPINKAQEFKSNWHVYSNKIKNQKFDFFSGNWELSSLEIKVFRIYTAKYDNEVVLNYNPLTQFNLKFKEINFDFADKGLSAKTTVKENIKLLKYDIKYNLPETKMSNPNAVAVVIGNANYQYIDNVKYALNDAQQIKTYLTSVLGFQDENIIFENDASKAVFERIFGTQNNFKGQLYNCVKKEKSDVFIFYSGHGAPGLSDKKGYFVPTDCDAQYIELQGYSLETLYNNLGNINSKSTTIVIDACFSGKGVIKNISSITVEPDMPKVFFENGVLIASSTGNEVATWADEKGHGLFTYFFLKSIHDHKNSDLNNDGNLTIKEIYNYISNESEGIPYYSGRLTGFRQHPLLSGANEDYVLVKF